MSQENHQPLEGIPASTPGVHTIQAAAGEILFRQGDDTEAGYLILDGVVEIEEALPNGRSFILCRHEKKSVLCPLTVLTGEPQLGTAYVRSAATVQVVPREEMLQLLQTDGNFCGLFHQHCFQHLYHLVRRLLDAQGGDLRSRLGMVLLKLAEKEEPAQGEPYWVVWATHQQIAQWVGASREAVSRELAALKRQGLLTTSRGKIVLHDLWKIQALLQE